MRVFVPEQHEKGPKMNEECSFRISSRNSLVFSKIHVVFNREVAELRRKTIFFRRLKRSGSAVEPVLR